ncbi:Arc family DNA-binding protein [Methylobacterium sp. P31]
MQVRQHARSSASYRPCGGRSAWRRSSSGPARQRSPDRFSPALAGGSRHCGVGHGLRVIERPPGGMRDRLAAAADIKGRSLNAGIVARLQASLDEHEPDNPFALRDASSAANGRGLADALADIVEGLDTIVGTLDGRCGARAPAASSRDGTSSRPGSGTSAEPATYELVAGRVGRCRGA